MQDNDQSAYLRATAIFKRGLKASSNGVHRTLNRAPKGKGWVPCRNAPTGMMCKPDKVREAIGYFKAAYDVFPDIVALNQIALSYEMLGEFEEARPYFQKMKEQALRQNMPAYVGAAEAGLGRMG